jgi:D-galactarolactone isomerase
MTPALAIPGACDCHIHVYEDKYPLAPTATFKPPHAPASAYREVQEALGLQRAIVVQPTGYGFDNRCTESAIAQLSRAPNRQALGIAIVPPEVDNAELARLHAAGFRGVRYMMLAGGLLPWSSLEAMAARIAPLGWVINLQLDGRDLPQYEARLSRLPCRLVIDHLGKFLGPVTPEHESFLALRRLLEAGRCWIKVSAPYESSRSGPPGYEDVAPLARVLLQGHRERCLWASNWPHPNVSPRPSEAALLDWFQAGAADAALAARVLVDNPVELFGF